MCVSPASPKGAESLSGSVLSEVCRVDRGAAVPGSEGEQVGPEAERRSLGIADREQQGQRGSCGSTMTLGRQVFPAPISRARRNASVQPWTSGLVGRLVPGLAALGGGLDPGLCPRLRGHLELTPQGACSDPAGSCHVQESSSRAVTRTATTGRCSVTRAVVTAGVWTSWAWS